MLAKGVAQVREAVDQWEKYTRMLEDKMDQVAGMVQPFTDLHAGYRELTDFRKIKQMARMGSAYRAEIMSPKCWNPVGSGQNCSIASDFIPTQLRYLDDSAYGIVRRARREVNAAGDQVGGLGFSQLEAVVRGGLGLSGGVGGPWLASRLCTGEDDDFDPENPGDDSDTTAHPCSPQWIVDIVGANDELPRTLARARYQKARTYRSPPAGPRHRHRLPVPRERSPPGLPRERCRQRSQAFRGYQPRRRR